jgi:hypothetical protein
MGKVEQTPVEWLIDKLVEEEFLYIDDKPNHMIPLGNLINQTKEMEKQQREKLAFEYFKAGQDSMEEGGKSFEQYYTETYG